MDWHFGANIFWNIIFVQLHQVKISGIRNKADKQNVLHVDHHTNQDWHHVVPSYWVIMCFSSYLWLKKKNKTSLVFSQAFVLYTVLLNTDDHMQMSLRGVLLQHPISRKSSLSDYGSLTKSECFFFSLKLVLSTNSTCIKCKISVHMIYVY